MDSSTSHSESAVPWRAVQLLLVAVATWAAGAAYTLRWNPEIAFFRRGDAVKHQWAEQLKTTHTNKIVIFGGSSCATSVDPLRMLERHQLPVLNLGFVAGIGADVLTRYAFENLQPGDTLIVALEQGLLSGSVELEPLGVQFLLASGHGELLRDDGDIPWTSALLDLRPGGYHVFTLLGKVLMGQPLYRYGPVEIETGGWHKVAARREFGVPLVQTNKLSAAGRGWLIRIRDECLQRNVRVACTIPWQFCLPENGAAVQSQNLQFLREMSAVLPVLREPSIGVHAVRGHFADTDLHPTAEAAALRTDELAATIKSWTTWTDAEIQSRLDTVK